MLAPIPQFPFLNPINSPDEAKYRQWITLKRLVEEGLLTQEEATALYEEEMQVREVEERFDILAPHFAIHVREELERTYDPELIYRGGLKVFTTIDLDNLSGFDFYGKRLFRKDAIAHQPHIPHDNTFCSTLNG